jgi:diguanylate cyclase (GGDEF)-like protein
LLIDLDGFKQVNDTHGHAIGDECLKVAARRLIESCGGAELVARIGGDEFAVLLRLGMTQADMETLAEGIIATMRGPVSIAGRPLRLSASVGLAPYRGGSSEDLFRQADIALYAAKAAGRDTSRTFKPA